MPGHIEQGHRHSALCDVLLGWRRAALFMHDTFAVFESIKFKPKHGHDWDEPDQPSRHDMQIRLWI